MALSLSFQGCLEGCSEFFANKDVDEDGYLHPTYGGDDCNDKNSNINPGKNDEPYDGVDADCSGADLTDVDEDGQDSKEGVGGEDCNDYDDTVGAGFPELCDGQDNDCNEATVEDDADGDKQACVREGSSGKDCNDSDATIYFGAFDIPYDGIDQDCFGGDVIDYDGDGEPGLPAGGTDCNDSVGTTDLYGFDESVEIYIPGGPFTMGSNSGDADEAPQHEVMLSAYCIDRIEVRNRDYRLCVEQKKCTPPSKTTSASGRLDYYSSNASEWDDYPVIWVNYEQASQYCAWRHQSLPTEAQWEKAARGGHCLSGGTTESCPPEDVNPYPTRTYPWGEDAPSCELANFSFSSGKGCAPENLMDTLPVTSLEQGASPANLLNLAGNVAEWTFDFYSETYYQESGSSLDPKGPSEGAEVVNRGAFFGASSAELRAANRASWNPTTSNNFLGFRCARWDFTPVRPGQTQQTLTP